MKILSLLLCFTLPAFGDALRSGVFRAAATGTSNVCYAPSISVNPVSKSAVTNTEHTISVTASGTALQYQWYLASDAVAGATSSSYATNSATAATNSYSVIVSNTCGTATSSSCNLAWTNSVPVTGPGLASVWTNYSTTSANLTNFLTSIPAGALIVAMHADESADMAATFSTSPDITLVTAAVADAANTGDCTILTNKFTAGGDLQVRWLAPAANNSSCVLVFTNWTSVGYITNQTAQSAVNIGFPTTEANSYICGVVSDWSANAYGALRGTGGTVALFHNPAAYAGLFFYYTTTTQGTYTIGDTATGQAAGVCAIEVK